jgi:hypothetical protein
MKETLSLPTSIVDMNDFQDELLTDDIIRYVPSIVQHEWQTYKLYKSRKYYIISRNIKNNAHSYFLERDYYKYQLEKCEYTITVINPEIVKRLKYIYNAMMDYLHNDKNEYEEKLDAINF